MTSSSSSVSRFLSPSESMTVAPKKKKTKKTMFNKKGVVAMFSSSSSDLSSSVSCFQNGAKLLGDDDDIDDIDGRTSSSSNIERRSEKHPHEKIVFYTHSLCPYAHRVRLCLDELHLLREEGGKVDIVDVDLSNKPKFFLDMTNGRGVVPLIEFSETGELVSESLRINERLWEEYYSDDDSSSLTSSSSSSSPSSYEDAKRFANACDQKFVSLGLQAIGGGWSFDTTRNERTLERFEREIWEIDALIEKHNDDDNSNTKRKVFLFGGDRASLADVAIYPFAERFELALQHFQGYTLGNVEYYHPPSPPSSSSSSSSSKHHQQPRHFQKWLKTMQTQPSSLRCAVKNQDALLKSWSRTKRLDYFDYETADFINP